MKDEALGGSLLKESDPIPKQCLCAIINNSTLIKGSVGYQDVLLSDESSENVNTSSVFKTLSTLE